MHLIFDLNYIIILHLQPSQEVFLFIVFNLLSKGVLAYSGGGMGSQVKVQQH